MGERVLGSTQDRRRSALGEESAAVPPLLTRIDPRDFDDGVNHSACAVHNETGLGFSFPDLKRGDRHLMRLPCGCATLRATVGSLCRRRSASPFINLGIFGVHNGGANAFLDGPEPKCEEFFHRSNAKTWSVLKI